MFKYNLYEPLELSGSFELGETGIIVGGKLILDPNRIPSLELQLFHEQMDSLGSSIGMNDYSKHPYIHAVMEGNTCCTIQNPVSRQAGFHEGGVPMHGLSKHVVFNEYFKEDATFDGVSVLYNLWPEFCHHQGFKQSAEYNADSIEVVTTDTQKLIFTETANFSTIHEESFFDAICFFPKNEQLVADIKATIEKARQEATIEHIAVGLKSEHLWFVRFEQKIEIENLNIVERDIWHFANLLFVLTYYPSTPIACDLFAPANTAEGLEYKANYPWFFAGSLNKKLLKKAEQFMHFWAPITFPKIKEAWEMVVMNWFARKEDILPFVGILKTNMEGGVSKFKFTRCADALELIGRKHKAKKHYEWVVDTYAFPPLKKYLLEIFETDSVEKLGVHITDARASIVHGVEQKRDTWGKVAKVAHSVECFELIIMSYLQQLIGVPDHLREAFQNYWLEKVKDIDWVKFQ